MRKYVFIGAYTMATADFFVRLMRYLGAYLSESRSLLDTFFADTDYFLYGSVLIYGFLAFSMIRLGHKGLAVCPLLTLISEAVMLILVHIHSPAGLRGLLLIGDCALIYLFSALMSLLIGIYLLKTSVLSHTPMDISPQSGLEEHNQ